MLNAGFRFICCHPDEDDDEYGNVNWRKNLLEKLPVEEMELLKGKQGPAPVQDTSFDLAAPGAREIRHRRFKSLGNHTVEVGRGRVVRREEVIKYLLRVKGQGAKVLELLYQERL